MSTQYYTASSIDGFIADPDNSLDWLFQFSEESGMEDQYPKFIANVGAMAMGSTTYEWVADHTGFLTDASKWEYTIPTWVFSSRDLPNVEGQTSGSCRATSCRFTRRWCVRRTGATSGWWAVVISSGSFMIV